MRYELLYPNGETQITHSFDEVLEERRENCAALITQVPETVEEEDMLMGFCYPGHECWED